MEAKRHHLGGALSRLALRWFRLPLAVAFVCLSAAITQFASAAFDRTLSFHNLNTGETVTVTYMRDGRYLPQGLAELDFILRDWRQDEAVEMDRWLLDLVWEVYRQTGSTQPINIISGYRSPTTNAMLRSLSNGVAQNSQHIHGNAMDIQFPDVDLVTLRNVAMRMQIGGVGFYPTSGSPFIHIDTGSVRHWPRMSRSQLAAVFPDGQSLHVPSDGTPLAGYQEAQLAYQQRGDQVVALFTDPVDAGPTPRLAALFDRGDPAPAPAIEPAIAVALAAATRIAEPPPARADIPGVRVTEPEMPALAFAPATEIDRDPLAILSEPLAPIATALTAPAPKPAPTIAPPIQRRWHDPLAVITAPSVAGSDLPIVDQTTTTRQAAFALLTAPNVTASPQFLAKPERVVAGGFLQPAATASSARFEGPMVVPVAMIDLFRLTTVAQAR